MCDGAGATCAGTNMATAQKGQTSGIGPLKAQWLLYLLHDTDVQLAVCSDGPYWG